MAFDGIPCSLLLALGFPSYPIFFSARLLRHATEQKECTLSSVCPHQAPGSVQKVNNGTRQNAPPRYRCQQVSLDFDAGIVVIVRASGKGGYRPSDWARSYRGVG